MSFSPVQHNLGADGTAATSATVALTGTAITAGNTVVGAVQWGNNPPQTLLSIQDDKGNSYTVADSINDASGQTEATFYLFNVPAGGPSTITATFSAATNFRRILWDEFSGVATASPVDGHVANINTGSTSTDAITSTNITTTANGDLIWSAYFDNFGGVTWTQGTGFAILDQGTAADNCNMGSEWLTQSTAGAIAGTWTQGTAGSAVAGVIALKAAGTAQVPYTPTPQLGPMLAQRRKSVGWSLLSDHRRRVLRPSRGLWTPSRGLHAPARKLIKAA